MNEEKIGVDEIEVRLAQTLKPTALAPAFRARLRDGLVMVSRHRVFVSKPNEPSWTWLIGAAAIGSAAGLIALAMRARTGHKSSQPPVQQSV